MNKVIFRGPLLATLIVVVVAIALAVAKRTELHRLHTAITLFDADRIVHNFSHMNEGFLSVPFEASPTPAQLSSSPQPLPRQFSYRGSDVDTEAFLSRRATTALLVLKDGQITFEDYYLGTGPEDRRISWSMNKSVVSALMGIVVDQGLVEINRPVDTYVPELADSGYAGVPVKAVLQMSSGVTWDEDYSAFYSDINRMGRAIALGGSLDEMAAQVPNGGPAGERFHYVSMDTHVLAMVIRSVTGRSMPDLLQDWLWNRIGAEDGGYWLTDGDGTAFALGGLNVRTRDYARFGQLYLQEGQWQGEQIVPRDWVLESTRAVSPHVQPGDDKFGYGYQWWLGPQARPGEFIAVGVYGQYIYINRPAGVVIVRNAADRSFMDETGSMAENVAFFRTVTDSL